MIRLKKHSMRVHKWCTLVVALGIYRDQVLVELRACCSILLRTSRDYVLGFVELNWRESAQEMHNFKSNIIKGVLIPV
jgi:hypothetical protein